jgi:methionine-rich copper-binding protein CopC
MSSWSGARFRAPRATLGWLAVGALALACVTRSASVNAAAFDHSNPRPGQVLIAAPARLELFAADDLAPSDRNAIDVRAADLREVDLRDAAIDPVDSRRLSVGLAPALGVGRYVVSFVDQTVDGAVDRGQFSFYVGAPATAAEREADAHLSVGDTATAQRTASDANNQSAVAIGIAVALAGTISAGTAIVLRRRSSAFRR